MKSKIIIILFLFFVCTNLKAQVKIGGTGSPHANSVLELDGGADKGLLLPRHTNAEMNAMMNAPEGMMIYNTSVGKIFIKRPNTWEIASGITLPLDQSYTVDNSFILKLWNLSANSEYGAIMGQASAGKGVVGWSDSGYGVLAHSNSGLGLYAHAASGTAFYATSQSGAAITTGSGNVGIGLLNPSVPLHIQKPTSTLLQLENSLSLLAGSRTDLLFKTGSYYTGVISTIGSSATTARIGFHTGAHTSSGFLIERMSIANNGNVGINNTAPSAKLDVVGTAEFNASGGGEKAILVNGEAVFTQAPAAEAAININGRIKTSGTNPRAFVVTAPSLTSSLLLDHPDLNGNPNAIILVTPRYISGQPYFVGYLTVGYENATQKWSLKSVGYIIDQIFLDVDIETCSGNCLNNFDIPTGKFSKFEQGVSFNVLVIGN